MSVIIQSICISIDAGFEIAGSLGLGRAWLCFLSQFPGSVMFGVAFAHLSSDENVAGCKPGWVLSPGPRVKESHWGYFSVYWCNQFQDVKYVPLPLSCCIYLGNFGNIASISSNSYRLRLIRPANRTSRGKGLDQPPWTAVTWCSTSHRIGTSAALCGLRIGGCLSVADQMPFVQHTHWKGLERTGMHICRECIDFVQSIFRLSFEKWTANIWRGHNTYMNTVWIHMTCMIYIYICQSPFVYVEMSIVRKGATCDPRSCWQRPCQSKWDLGWLGFV